MKRTYLKKCIILSVLVFSIFSFANGSETQLQEAKKTSKAFFEAENYKWVLDKLATALKAERKSKAVTNAMKKIWSTAKHLDKNQMKTLLNRFAKASDNSLKKLAKMSGKQIGGYIKSVTGRISQSAGKLRQIIAGSGDEAGNAALRMLNTIEDALTKTGNVSKDLLRKAGKEARGLNPKRAKAYLDLLKNKFVKKWKGFANSASSGAGKGASTMIGTVVDGIFVLNDAVNIYYSDDDAEDKYIKATSKIIEYGSSTGAGVASAALGGGMGPGLVIALSANRVATLYTEMKMLEKEKRLAKNAEKEVIINNGLLVRRQLLKISQKIKAGEYKNARFLLNKVFRFLLDMEVQNRSKLLDLQKVLEAKLIKAEHLAAANKVLNEARYPYRKAFKLYLEGHNLVLAKRYAEKSYDFLKGNSYTYPELLKLKAMPNIKKLIASINTKIANATDPRIVSISGKKKVMAGEYEHYTLKLSGGIPDYKPVGIDGYGTINSATVYWEAPKEPGKQTVSFTIMDDLGKTITDTVSIMVVGDEEDIEESKTDKPPVDVWAVLKKTTRVSVSTEPAAFNYYGRVGASSSVTYQSTYTPSHDPGRKYVTDVVIKISSDGSRIKELRFDTVDTFEGKLDGGSRYVFHNLKLSNLQEETSTEAASATYRMYSQQLGTYQQAWVRDGQLTWGEVMPCGDIRSNRKAKAHLPPVFVYFGMSQKISQKKVKKKVDKIKKSQKKKKEEEKKALEVSLGGDVYQGAFATDTPFKAKITINVGKDGFSVSGTFAGNAVIKKGKSKATMSGKFTGFLNASGDFETKDLSGSITPWKINVKGNWYPIVLSAKSFPSKAKLVGKLHQDVLSGDMLVGKKRGYKWSATLVKKKK